MKKLKTFKIMILKFVWMKNKEELENIYNDLNQKYWDIVNKYYSPKKQEILKKLEIIKKKGANKFEEDIKKILENDENKKNNNMKEKINDIEKVKELKKINLKY